MMQNLHIFSLKKYIKGDPAIWGIALFLSVISILSVYSTTGSLAFKYKGGNTEAYLIERVIFILGSFVVMGFVQQIKYTYFSRISQILLLFSVPLLILTLYMGSDINDASRWLKIPGIGLSFQTSDLAKVALVTYIASLLAAKQDQMDDYRSAFIPALMWIGLICALIFPANFSTAAMLFLICFLLMFIARIPMKHLGILMLFGIIAIGITVLLIYYFPDILPRGETWKNRIFGFIGEDADANYQAEQAKMVIANGNILGTGPTNNPNKYFLPQGYSDFIFAMIIGEYGIFGGVLIIFSYLLLLYRSIRIATKTKYAFAALLSIGLGILIVVQAFINMAVAVNLFPVTGQPLPMVSMGGTGTLFTALAFGMILSVSRSVEEKEITGKEEDHVE